MCNRACLAYGEAQLAVSDVRGKRVIEVGARDVNGSLRSRVEKLGPSQYVGVDIEPGRGVDEICDAEEIVNRFGPMSFDVVICTEVLEHVRSWRTVTSNLKHLLAPGGRLLITTRSFGFPYHAFPYDFWRYEIDDMHAIFSDLVVENAVSDPGRPGVFVTAIRPEQFEENDLSSFELYSMVKRRRCRDVSNLEVAVFINRWRARRFVGKRIPPKLRSYFK